jgi:hypothetical protein
LEGANKEEQQKVLKARSRELLGIGLAILPLVGMLICRDVEEVRGRRKERKGKQRRG